MSSSAFGSLPAEVLKDVFSRLSDADLASCGLVCKQWRVQVLGSLKSLKLAWPRVSSAPINSTRLRSTVVSCLAHCTSVTSLDVTELITDWTAHKVTLLPRFLTPLGNLQSLEVIRLNGRSVPEETMNSAKPYFFPLPGSFSQLHRLRKLFLRGMWVINNIDVIQDLPTLQLLACHNCSITSLPEGISRLTNLETLELRHCQVSSLPHTLGSLTAITTLELCHLPLLKTLPESIGSLKRLKHLKLTYCPLVRRLPASLLEVQSLQLVTVHRCDGLPFVEDLWCLVGNLNVQTGKIRLQGEPGRRILKLVTC